MIKKACNYQVIHEKQGKRILRKVFYVFLNIRVQGNEYKRAVSLVEERRGTVFESGFLRCIG
jgi:hypothetical protein